MRLISLLSLLTLMAGRSFVQALRRPEVLVRTSTSKEALTTLTTSAPTPVSWNSVMELPRGGASLPVLDQKTLATAVIGYLAVHGLVDIALPSKVVEFYGLDNNTSLNAFYFSQIGALALNAVVLMLSQLYYGVDLSKAVGFSVLPLTLLTIYQLATGKYAKAGVNKNSGIVTLCVNALTLGITLYEGDKLPFDPALWITGVMALSGLHGLNLVISAQTLPLPKSSTIVLRMLGTVSSYIAAAVLSQKYLFSKEDSIDAALKAFGCLMGTLGVTSLPVWLDLRTQDPDGPSTVYGLYILFSLAFAVYMLK